MLIEDGLRSKPIWSIEETGLQKELRKIQSYWKIILGEALTVLDFQTGGFTKYFEDINDSGNWDHFVLFSNGNKEKKNCKKMPITCSLMVSEIARNEFGQVTLRFSSLLNCYAALKVLIGKMLTTLIARYVRPKNFNFFLDIFFSFSKKI